MDFFFLLLVWKCGILSAARWLLAFWLIVIVDYLICYSAKITIGPWCRRLGIKRGNKRKAAEIKACFPQLLPLYLHTHTHTHIKPNPIGGRGPQTCLCNSKTCNRSLVLLAKLAEDKENQAAIKQEAAIERKTNTENQTLLDKHGGGWQLAMDWIFRGDGQKWLVCPWMSVRLR